MNEQEQEKYIYGIRQYKTKKRFYGKYIIIMFAVIIITLSIIEVIK